MMSSFLLKKSICGKLCFSVSIWRNRLPNRIECLWRRQCFIGNNVQRLVSPIQRRQFWPEWQKAWKSAQEGWGLSIADSFGRGRYPIAKNACRAIGCFSSSHFHAATCLGEGSKDQKRSGCHMNWTIGRWSDAKTHAKFCLPDKKESHSCIGLWQAMKSGSIFRILNARNLGLIPSNHQHLPQNQIASDGRRCCVWWDQEGVIYYELLKPGETVNAHHYQQLIKLHRALREKRLHYRKRQADFPPRQRIIAHVNNSPKLLGDTQLGSAIPSRLLTRLGIFWLSPVFVDGSRARWAALRFLRRRLKMAWWVVCFERWEIFLAWYTQIVRKMGKMYS